MMTSETTMNEATPPLTFGDELVGKTFNPSLDPRVDRAKEICAELADLVYGIKPVEGKEYICNLIRGKALSEILSAQMLVVKSLTLK